MIHFIIVRVCAVVDKPNTLLYCMVLIAFIKNVCCQTYVKTYVKAYKGLLNF